MKRIIGLLIALAALAAVIVALPRQPRAQNWMGFSHCAPWPTTEAIVVNGVAYAPLTMTSVGGIACIGKDTGEVFVLVRRTNSSDRAVWARTNLFYGLAM